jgi:HlyD family secretion protein
VTPAPVASTPASSMDVPRPRRRLLQRRALRAGLSFATLGGMTVVAARARESTAPPTVDRAAISTGTVTRGRMMRQVGGVGTLVAEEIRWVTAPSPGRVERIALLPGVTVKADTVLVELGNPELAHGLVELAADLRASEAQRVRLGLDIETDRLAQESLLAQLQSELIVGRLEADGDEQLRARGFGPELSARRSRAKVEALAARLALEHRRLEISQRSGRARLQGQDAEIARVCAQHQLRRAEVDGLTVRAGIDGVLQRLGDEQPLRVGQLLAAGAALARIASQTRLKAEIKIPETQAKDVQLGQAATIDTRNGVVKGHVSRIDPSVQNATVTVDVELEEGLPAGARPDLSVDGTILLERLDGVLVVGRPVAFEAHAHAEARLFKLVDGGRGAVRVPVHLGRSSIDSVEITAGLLPGDQIILSDMSPWDSHDRIRLH